MEQKYSILMSVYGKEKVDYLKDSIDSLLNQTVKPEQIILVKDGPLTTELDQLINHYVESNELIFTIVPLSKNVGLGLALNEGIRHCRNELMARMDTDDISHPKRIEVQLERFKMNPRIDIVGTLTAEFSGDISNVISARVVPKHYDDIMKFSRRRSPFNHATVMYKKDAVESVNGYNDVLRNEDYDLFIRMLSNGSYGENIQEPLYYVRLDEGYHTRRKSWVNCKNYINVVYNSWKKGYSTLGDLTFVVSTQVGMFLAPIWLLEYVSNKFLRKNYKK